MPVFHFPTFKTHISMSKGACRGKSVEELEGVKRFPFCQKYRFFKYVKIQTSNGSQLVVDKKETIFYGSPLYLGITWGFGWINLSETLRLQPETIIKLESTFSLNPSRLSSHNIDSEQFDASPSSIAWIIDVWSWLLK